jgi:hypothetical protein
MQSGYEFVSPAKGQFQPIPTNFQRAAATKPMGIDPPAFALCDDFRALGDQL